MAVVGRRPQVLEEASRDVQTLADHDGIRSVVMPQVVEARVRHDRGRFGRLGPAPEERPLGRRSVSGLVGQHPLPGSRLGEPVRSVVPSVDGRGICHSPTRLRQLVELVIAATRPLILN